MAPGDVPQLWQMNTRAQLIALAYYEAGYAHGVEAGRLRVLDETWGPLPDEAHAGAGLKVLALQPAHADLLDRRGEHRAAEQYRAMLRERGVIA